MSNQTVVVSFEGDKVNVVYATKVKNSFVVDDALTVAESAFDDFLQQEKTRHFIVVSSFTQCFSDTLTLPPAPDNLLRSVIENEVRKITKMQMFVFIYTVLGEKVVEQKKVKEVFVFAVGEEHIRALVKRFIMKGKIIDALYPDIFALAGFVGAGRDTVLGVLETGTNKHFFLAQEGQIQFVRVVQAFDVGMRDHDMQNVTMTVNFCRQTLRLNPQRIVLVGRLCRNFFVRTNIGIPIVSFTHPVFSQKIRGKYEAVDYMLPIAALFVEKKIGIDLLPQQDKTLFRIDKTLRYGAQFFALLTLIILIQAGFSIKWIFDFRKDIVALRRNLPEVNITLERYQSEQAAFNTYRPLLESYRRNAGLPDVYFLLQQLADIPHGTAIITSITAAMQEGSADYGSLDLVLKGNMASEDLVHMQRDYLHMLAGIKSLKNFTLLDESLDLKTREWNIHGQYK